jgi:molecular chaperone DnaJ
MAADYYAALGVSKDASAEEIKRAYRAAALRYHPDRAGGDAEAEKKFKEVAEAYDTLGDENKRRAYDRRFSPRGGGFPFDMGSIFSSIFTTPSTRQENLDIMVEATLTLEECVKGCNKPVQVSRNQWCTGCRGVGATEFSPCAVCQGRGYVEIQQSPWLVRKGCGHCKETGKVPTSSCKDCGGSGRTALPDENLAVAIPAGIDHGLAVKVAGKGHIAPDGRTGNLLVRVAVEKHRYLHRKGLDLYCTVPLTYSQLVLGTKVRVKKIDGSEELVIPPGTRPGARFSIWGQGVPDYENPSHKGDLVAVVRLEVPEDLGEEYKKAVEALRAFENVHPSEFRKGYQETVKD